MPTQDNRVRSATNLAVLSLIPEPDREKYAERTLRDAQADGVTNFCYLRARIYLQTVPAKAGEQQGGVSIC
jgi:hypothetical protein